MHFSKIFQFQATRRTRLLLEHESSRIESKFVVVGAGAEANFVVKTLIKHAQGRHHFATLCRQRKLTSG